MPGRRVGRRRKRRQVRPRFLIVLCLIAGLIGVGIFMLSKEETVSIMQGTVSEETPITGVLVRQETVVKNESFGKIIYRVQEGERVAKDTLVAEVYSAGYSERTLQDLYAKQQDILNHQQNTLLKDIVDEPLQALNQSISEKITAIAQTIQAQNFATVLTMEGELRTFFTQRQDLLRDKFSATQDDTLNKLYGQQTKLMQEISSVSKPSHAPEAGVVSFYLDGCEALLTPSTFKNVTVKDVKNIIGGSSVQKAASANAMQPIYKIMDTQKWYLYVQPEEKERGLLQNERYHFAFDGFHDAKYQGICTGFIGEGDDRLSLVEFSQEMDALVSERVVKGQVIREFSGLMVPSSSIKVKEGVRGVYLMENRTKKFLPVEVMAMDESRAIIRSLDGTTPLAINQYVLK